MFAGSGDCPLHDRADEGDPKALIAPAESPGGAGLEVGLRLGPVPGFPTSLAAPMWTRFSMDSANTAASNQPCPPPVTAERIADAFESYARKLAEAGVPLDRIAEGLSMAAVRAEVAHREDLMHKLRDTVAAWGQPLNAASGPRPMRTVAGLTSEAGQEAGPNSANLAPDTSSG
jgi:hypothetical protein